MIKSLDKNEAVIPYVKNNDFIAAKSKKITISGTVFDAQPLLKTLYKKTERKPINKER